MQVLLDLQIFGAKLNFLSRKSNCDLWSSLASIEVYTRCSLTLLFNYLFTGTPCGFCTAHHRGTKPKSITPKTENASNTLSSFDRLCHVFAKEQADVVFRTTFGCLCSLTAYVLRAESGLFNVEMRISCSKSKAGVKNQCSTILVLILRASLEGFENGTE